MQLTRDKFVPMLDVTRGEVAGTYEWVPVDLSTQFELSYNPSTDTKSYICYANDSTVLSSYALELPQEIVLDSANPMYAFISEFAREKPIGASAELPVMIVYPDLSTGAPTDADVYERALVTIDTLNTVDGVLSFNLALNGDAIRGTVAGMGTETVTFTPKA